MARSQDRTERPTERRKREARREGRTARSQEVGTALSLVGVLLALRFLSPTAGGLVLDKTREMLTLAGTGTIAPGVGSATVAIFAGALLPFLAISVVAALVAGVGQVGFTFAPKAAKPKLSNLRPRRGLQRFKPTVLGWDLLRTGLKLGLLVVILWAPLTEWIDDLGRPLSLGEGLAQTGGQVLMLVTRAVLLAAVIAVADYAVVRFRTQRELRMTKQELKEELKHQEGDPLVRSHRRRRQTELSRNRMIRDVAAADVVVTNPTRLAVALAYGQGEPAPRVVAKGANRVAARIRAEAYRNGVVVMEDRPLARALFRRVKVGHYIPVALFEAVAVVLATAYRRRRRVA